MGTTFNKATIGVPWKIIKLASSHFCESLTYIFKPILTTGCCSWYSDPTNFCPISTLSTFTQIFDKLIHKQLINYIEKQKILFQFQFGFRKGHSTAEAIAEITNMLRKAIDNNLYTCGVLLDFSKAFDTVNHKILLGKLDAYGIRGYLWTGFKITFRIENSMWSWMGLSPKIRPYYVEFHKEAPSDPSYF